MVTIVIFVVIGIVWFLRTHWEDVDFRYDFGFTILTCFISLLAGIAMGIIGFLIAWALPVSEYKDTENYKIVNLQDANQLNGHCFLGSGHVGEQMVYTFYYESEPETYKLKQIPARYCEIKYTTGQPTAIKHVLKEGGAWYDHFGINFYESSWTFEVPNGSVQNNYTLDAN